eukprot:3354121-Amphidinium_carterae.2
MASARPHPLSQLSMMSCPMVCPAQVIDPGLRLRVITMHIILRNCGQGSVFRARMLSIVLNRNMQSWLQS